MVQVPNEGRRGADATAPDADATDPMAAFQADITKARELILEGERQAALDLCLGILDKEDLPIRIAATLSLVMRDLGQTNAADHIREVLLNGLRSDQFPIPSTPSELSDRAEIFADLDAFEEAEDMCRRTLEIEPDNMGARNAVIAFLLEQDKTQEAHEMALAFCERGDNTFDAFMYFAGIFGHLEHKDIATSFLDKAQEQCKTSTEQAKIDHIRAAFDAPTAELDQHGMAVGIFDDFAENYDAQLEKIENNGPSMVYTAIEELGLPKTQTRRVLDAGCGTGLCASFLRPYANEITGADLSTKMLEKAKEKQLYDFLSRTDLSIPVTFPEGSFDIIVCADVLVYFGTLKTVFENFLAKLNPGGWLLLTAEAETDKEVKTGFKLYPSGRYKHTEEYLVDTLAEVGFPKPKLLEHGRLRNEMGRPVLGTIIAVQKPALLFT